MQWNMGRIFCIDYGKKRCGIAVTDPLRISATPLQTVGSHEILATTLAYIQTNEVDEIVIGNPTTMLGEHSESWTYIEPFVNVLKKRLPSGVKLTLYDERFTSSLAHRAMLEAGLKKSARRDKALVDKIAATIILSDYLQSIYNQ